MADSVYRVTEVIGVSENRGRQPPAARSNGRVTVRDLRVAEVVRQDLTIEDGKVSSFRIRLGLSFK